jgi:hypothetical protein
LSAAIDLIRRPDGELVFLELNGNGQFLWAEDLSGVAVSAAVVQLLVGQLPPLGKAASTARREKLDDEAT